MIKDFINKEKFAEEFENHMLNGVEPIDALLTIQQKYELTEDQIPKLMNENILHQVSKDAARLNFIKYESSTTLDDFF